MTDRAEYYSDAAIQARLGDRLAELDRTFDPNNHAATSQGLRDQLARDKAGFTALAQGQAVHDRRVAEVHRLRDLLEAVPPAAKAVPAWSVALEFALIDLAAAAAAAPLGLSEVTTVIERVVQLRQAEHARRTAEALWLRDLLSAVPPAAKAAPRWAVALEFALIDLAGAATVGPLDLAEVTTVIEWLVREGGSADAPQTP